MLEKSHKKLNVLFLSSWYPNREFPTLGNFVQKHAEAAGIYNNVTVLAMFSDAKIKQIEVSKNKNSNITEYIVYYPKLKFNIKGINFIWGYFLQKKAFKKIYKEIILTEGKPDLVHLNIIYPIGLWALYLKKKYKIPYVVTENSTGLHIGTAHAYPSTILNLCKRILKKADMLLPVSEDLKHYMKQMAPNAKFDIVSNVVDEKIFSLKNETISEKTKFIHISTAYEPQKNVIGILRTIHKISSYRKDFHLDLVSDGDTEHLKDLVRSLNIQDFVSFYSTKTTEEISNMLKDSDALLLFSNFENFPCVIAESLMIGLPVISSNVNGISEHINAQNGILVHPRNEDELEKAIVHFLDHKSVYNHQEIRTYAESHFGYIPIGKAFDKNYRKILKVD